MKVFYLLPYTIAIKTLLLPTLWLRCDCNIQVTEVLRSINNLCSKPPLYNDFRLWVKAGDYVVFIHMVIL